MAPIYGYAPRGERLRLRVPRRRGKNTTLLSSMTLSGMGPSLAVEGATTARMFEAYVKKVLAPSLRAGQVVVMDNLGAHRPKRVRELVEQRGCELLYLPSYSPDHRTPSKRPSPRSSTSYARRVPGAGGRWWRRLVRRSRRSVLETPGASSSMPDTALRVNYCETRCQKGFSPKFGLRS